MSIVKVAKAAGVTHGTVSRVINGRGKVSETTANRVREAMARLASAVTIVTTNGSAGRRGMAASRHDFAATEKKIRK